MSYTYAKFKTYLKFICGNREDVESIGGDNMYGVWINSAYKQLTTSYRFWDLQRNFRFPELETSTSSNTTDGTAYISVPSDNFVPLYLYDSTNDRFLDYIRPKEYFEYTDRSDTDNEGEPTEWTWTGSYFYLHPTPDDTYAISVHYREVPEALSASTDTTTIGDIWDKPILWLAAYEAKMMLREFDDAEGYKKAFIEHTAGMIGYVNEAEKSLRKTFHMPSHFRNYGFG